MTSWALIWRRARAGLGLVLTILALVTVTTAIIAGTVGYSRAAATVAAREALTGAESADDAALRVQTRQADDPLQQDNRARKLIDEAFTPAQVTVSRSLASEPRPVERRDRRIQLISSDNLEGAGGGKGADGDDAPGGNDVVGGDAGFEGLIEVTEGHAPQSGGGAIQGALHTGAAAQWDVSVGDVITIDGIDVEVIALFRPLDPTAPAWVGDPLAANGFTDDLVGPMIVAPEDLIEFTEPPFAQWVIQPDADNLQPDDLGPLAAAAGALRSTMDTDGVAIRGIRVDGDLAPTVALADRNLQTARALNVLPLIVLLTVSVIAVAQLARILASARTSEVEFLLARGASRRQVFGWSLAEAAGISAIGTALGMAAATGVLQAVPAGAQQVGTVVLVATLTGLAVLLALTAVTAQQVRHLALRRLATPRSGRTRQAAAWGTAVLTLSAAGLSWVQLHRYGSPLVTADDGTLSVDYVAGAAPALLLAAAGVVALILFAPIARLGHRATTPTAGLTAHLSTTHVSRGLTSYAVPVVLTVLAVGVTTVSGMYAATSADLRDGLSNLAQGADVRATLDDQHVQQSDTIATFPPVADGEGVDASAPVWIRDTRIGEVDTVLIAASMDQLAEVAIVPPGAADPGLLSDRLSAVGEELSGGSAGSGGIDIPLGVAASLDVSLDLEVSTETLSDLSADVDDFVDFLVAEEDMSLEKARREALDSRFREVNGGVDVSLSLLLRDVDTGVVSQLTVDVLQVSPQISLDGSGALQVAPASGQESVDLPASVAGHKVVRIDLITSPPVPEYDLTAMIGVLVDGEIQPATQSWIVDPPAPARADVPEDPSGEVHADAKGRLIVTGEGTTRPRYEPTGTIRLLPGPRTDAPLPLAITQSIATSSDLKVGSAIEVNVFGATVPAAVAAVVDAVPGSLDPNVVLADAEALSRALIDQDTDIGQPTQIWVSAAEGVDPSAVADRAVVVPGFISASAAPTAPVTDANAAVRLVFWVASAGSILLAVTGIAAVSATSLRVRRPEVAVLRALGMPSRGQARARALELGSVVFGGVIFGVAAGWLVALAVIPELASATTLPGRAMLPAALRLELPLWLTLLGIGVAAVAAIAAVLAFKVKGQALDRTYREEIR